MRERDNVGVLDTAIRSIVACVLLALAFEQVFSFPVTVTLAVVGSLLWITCATGVCVLYKLLGINTYQAKH